MDESKNTTGNTDVVRSSPSLEPSYLYKSCLTSHKISVCIHNHLVYLVVVPVPVQVHCVMIDRARPAWHKQQEPKFI